MQSKDRNLLYYLWSQVPLLNLVILVLEIGSNIVRRRRRRLEAQESAGYLIVIPGYLTVVSEHRQIPTLNSNSL